MITVILLFLQGWGFNASALFFSLRVVDVQPLKQSQENVVVGVKSANKLVDVCIFDGMEHFYSSLSIP